VLLYELLTNTLPIAPKRSTLGAVEEAILEGDAPLASSRVQDRSTAKALRGEVDAILAKAMQREPGRRYATADAMAHGHRAALERRDRERRGPTAWVTGCARGAAELGGGGCGYGRAGGSCSRAVGWRWCRLSGQHESAERERVVKEFVFETFKTNTSAGGGGEDLRQLPAELLLARGARLIETKFSGQTELQAELYGVVARILLDMGASEQAIDYAIKQVESLSAIDAAPEHRADATLLVSEALRGVGRLADAETRARAALSLAAPGGSVRLRTRLLLVELMVLDRRHDDAAEELNSTDLEIATAAEPHHLLQARSDFLRAGLLSDSNRFAAAKPLYQRAIDRTLATQGPASTLAARMQIGFAGELLARSDAAAARPLYDAAFTTLRAAGGADEIAAVMEEADAARLLLEFDPTFSFKAADTILAHGLATLDRIGSRVPAVVRARVESIRGCSMEGWGEVTKGYALLSQSIAVMRATALNEYTPGAGCLGLAAMETGRHAEAERELVTRLKHFTRGPAGRSPDKSPMYVHVAFNRVMQGQLSTARAVLSGAPEFARLQGAKEDATYYSAFIAAAHALIDLEEGKHQKVLDRLVGLEDEQYNLLDVEMIRGNALCGLGQWKSAWPLFDKGLLRLEANNSPNMPRLARWRAIAGLCKMAAGDKTVAMEMARLARDAFAAQPGVSPYFKAPLIKLERKLGLKLPPP
jgi:tetratricopeptide (TPR) repeat protein